MVDELQLLAESLSEGTSESQEKARTEDQSPARQKSRSTNGEMRCWGSLFKKGKTGKIFHVGMLAQRDLDLKSFKTHCLVTTQPKRIFDQETKDALHFDQVYTQLILKAVKMNFYTLKDDEEIKVDRAFVITAHMKKEITDAGEGGVSINFMKNCPPADGEDKNVLKDVLFHFNPRPNNIIVLNTCIGSSWQTERHLKGNDEKATFMGDSFELKIAVDQEGSTFGVFLNGNFQTHFKTKSNITETKYIGFSPCIEIKGVKTHEHKKS
ncbi:uncharacterized protein LOC144619219 [Crassostrea virginica]